MQTACNTYVAIAGGNVNMKLLHTSPHNSHKNLDFERQYTGKINHTLISDDLQW